MTESLRMLGATIKEGNIKGGFMFCHFKCKKTEQNFVLPIWAPWVIAQLPIKKGLLKKNKKSV